MGADTAAQAWGVRALSEIGATIVAPATVVTALTLYFGTISQQTFFRHFGIDGSLLGFSTQRYIQESPDALFPVLLMISLMGLVALRLHLRISREITTRRERSYGMLTWAGRMMSIGGAGLLILGAFSYFWQLPFATPFLFQPLSLGLGAGAFVYGAHLHHRINRIKIDPSDRPLATVSNILAGVLITLGLFWATFEYAAALSRGRATQLAAQLYRQPGAVVYSNERLSIEGPGVTETSLDGTDAAYRFRYNGLRLLVRSGGHYFLLPEGWTRQDGAAIVVPEGPALRLEFTPGSS